MKIEKYFPQEGRQDFFKYIIVDSKGSIAKDFEGKEMYFEEFQLEQVKSTLEAIKRVSVLEAQHNLNELKESIIGIFKGQGVYELVLSVYEDAIDTINITQFGAIQENYGVPQRFGTLILFPDNMNMNEMLKHPFVWSSFIEQFN
jgi:hypothetical protein